MNENGIVSTTYGGQNYKLVKLAPKEAGRLATRLGKLLASLGQDEGVVAKLMTKAKEADEKGENAAVAAKSAVSDILKSADIISALAGGVANLDADALYDIGLACVDGKLFADSRLHDDAAFNKHFAEHPKNMLPIMAWAIKENCGGFFGLGAQD